MNTLSEEPGWGVHESPLSTVRIFIYYIGKPRDEHANAIAAEYLKRTKRYAAVETREINPARADWLEKHASAYKILLDPPGKTLDSAAFTAIIEKSEMLGQDVVFVIGGHDGLPPPWKARADLLLSLSQMTWPHELARAMLAEQIYRAFTTLRGHPYPR